MIWIYFTSFKGEESLVTWNAVYKVMDSDWKIESLIYVLLLAGTTLNKWIRQRNVILDFMKNANFQAEETRKNHVSAVLIA